MIRRHYLFYGRVQGVGFRFTTYQKQKSGLTGFCNLSDGSVEACIQGEEKLIDYSSMNYSTMFY
ncbi:MAG: acylphosphatase [Thomasclavelia ramosa]